jgi:hypothetical protein
MAESTFATKNIHSWPDFINFINPKGRPWIFRGQHRDNDLTSSLERALSNWGLDRQDAPQIECQLVREFRRRILDPSYERIQDDTLYCLALMRHYGAPARLLDCTYSLFVAAKFALEQGSRDSVIYCFNGDWCQENVRRLFGEIERGRKNDKTRDDRTFVPMYQPTSPLSARRFVYYENPLHLNERLTIQQGVFLCPGDVTSTFLDNIHAMEGWDSEDHIVKLLLQLDQESLRVFAANLKKMNVSSAVLFPGLEGFAKSLGEHMLHYRDMAKES